MRYEPQKALKLIFFRIAIVKARAAELLQILLLELLQDFTLLNASFQLLSFVLRGSRSAIS